METKKETKLNFTLIGYLFSLVFFQIVFQILLFVFRYDEFLRIQNFSFFQVNIQGYGIFIHMF